MIEYPPLIYVAGAYTGNVSEDIIKAEKASISLIRNGWHVFTPHKNTAGYENYVDLLESTWIEENINILKRCDAVDVVDNGGTSSGTKGDIAAAQELVIPIFWDDELIPDCAQMDVRNARWWQ